IMSVTASGDGLSYQWQANFNDGNGFVSLIDDVAFFGATTANLLITNANSSFHQSQYRCLVSSSTGCSLASQAATLTIQPSRLHVNASAPAGGNGLSWAAAYQRIEQALMSSSLDSCGSEIWVAAGTYAPGNSPGGAYHMTNHVAIYGGFAGGETALYERN